MRIAIPIKQVPDTKSVRLDESTGTLVRDGIESIVNPLDLYAIELALQARERLDGETTAISMGPPKAEEALREALAMGIDHAVLATDRTFAGSDTWATAKVLAETIRYHGAPDLVICGERATDGDTGQVGPALAAFLGLPVAAYVNSVKKISRNSITVSKLLEDGEETVELPLPALITVVKEVAVPRLPTLSGKRRAISADILIVSNDNLRLPDSELGLKGSPTRVAKTFTPKATRECVNRTAATAEEAIPAARDLMAFLNDRGIRLSSEASQ